MRVHRLIAILMMIEKKGKVKANLLASELEVSTRTIYRDIDILCEAGFPLYATTGPDGGISFSEYYSLGIDTEAAPNINILPALLKQLPSIPDKASTALSIQAGFQELERILKGNPAQASPLSKRILIDNDTWWGEASDPFDIRTVIDALWTLQSLKILYQRMDGSSSCRIIHPYGLILKHSAWYVVAYCQTAKDMRTFRCERILESHSTEEYYHIPASFDLSAHWDQSVQNFTSTLNDGNDYLVTLEIPSDYIDHFVDTDIAWNSKAHDRYIGTLNMNSFEFAKSDLIDILAFVKVVEPPELVEFAKSTLEEQLLKY